MLIEQRLLRKQLKKKKKGIAALLDTTWKPYTSTGNILVKRDTELQHEKMKPSDKAGFVRKQ